MTGGEKLKIWLAVIIFLSVTGWARGAGEPNDWLFLQLTDNTYNDRYPEISGSSVVWQSWVNNQDAEIFLYDGVTTSRLTDNAYDEDYPGISGLNVIWRYNDQVLLYDGMDVIQVSDDGYFNAPAHIFGSNVVWDGYDGSDYEIFLYNTDSDQITQLTDNSIDEWEPYASDTHVVWYGFGGGDYEIYLYDIETGQTVQLTNNSYEDREAYVSDSYVVWLGWKSGNSDVFLYDIETGVTTQLTNTPFDERGCRVSGSNVVWYGLDDQDWDFEIYLYKGQSDEILKLSDDSYDDFAPDISDLGVVWYGKDGSDYEIYMYDIESGQNFQLSDNSYTDIYPKISGLNVVWYGSDGSDDEIYFAGPAGDIEVSFLTHDFGDVYLGSSEVASLTISNVESGSLTIADIAFLENDGNDFSATYGMELPIVLQGGQSLDVMITYTPSTAETVSAVLEIQSDDLDEALIEVELSGTGIENQSGPAEKMEEILAFFDWAVEEGSLYGSGHGRSAEMQLKAFRNMLRRADFFIEKGMFRASCWQLRNAYMRTDGLRRPKDFVAGQAAAELAYLIKDMMDSMECKCSAGWPLMKFHNKHGMKECCLRYYTQFRSRHHNLYKCHR